MARARAPDRAGARGVGRRAIAVVKQAESRAPLPDPAFERTFDTSRAGREVSTDERLRQIQKMETIGTLAAGIAHDFNNILGAILGFAQLTVPLLPPGGLAARNVEEILHATERAKTLVQQILLFARHDPRDRRHVSLGRLTEDALRLVRASLPTTIAVRAQLEKLHDGVLADPTQLAQVVLNLCTNASHAMRARSGILAVTSDRAQLPASRWMTSGQLRAGPYVRLRVSDTGEGIPVDVLPRIFEPFFTTKGRGHGSGLGLAVVHGIVTAHGGAIQIESHPGSGTTVEVWLPHAAGEIVEGTGATPTPPRGEGRVLFVDDEPMLVEVGIRMLEASGYEVVGHTSSAAALAAFEAMPDTFVAVVTDQTMPTMTGDTLAARLLRIRPDLPVILCTGFSERFGPEQAHALGVRAYLTKPVAHAELVGAVHTAINPGRNADETWLRFS